MNNSEAKTCQNCRNQFTIESEDFAFYEKIKVPAPTWCPECRLIRRLAFRNERSLYKRKCDLCGAEQVLMYPADTPFPVYCKECWWSDKWDAKQYAREYDFSRPFFEQMKELIRAVPRPGKIHQGANPGSDYTNRVTDQKNCYLTFGSTRTENSRYGTFLNDSKDCLDCFSAQNCERCYECIDCFQCYGLAFSQECNNCVDSWFLYNCNNCQNCFGCVNLRNKSYCLFNEQLSKEEYQKRISSFALGSRIFYEGLRARFEQLKQTQIVPEGVIHKSQNSSGNWIENSKNVHRSFNCHNIEEGRYVMNVFDEKDSMDHCYWGNGSELLYECINIGNQSGRARFSNESWNQAYDIEYSMNCHNSRSLFGCIGLRNASFCIFNKSYSEHEYRELVAKIREHMAQMPYIDRRGREYRYGEFFPAELSPHAWNETLAQEFFPISREEVTARGYAWRETEEKSYSISRKAVELPDTIQDAKEDLAKEIIGCAHGGACNEQCTSAFRILPEDLELYKKARLPLPVLCPNCRHYQRVAMRNPLKLWPNKCMCAGTTSEKGDYKNAAQHFHAAAHCPSEFLTSHNPELDRAVYCLQCYNSEVV